MSDIVQGPGRRPGSPTKYSVSSVLEASRTTYLGHLFTLGESICGPSPVWVAFMYHLFILFFTWDLFQYTSAFVAQATRPPA